MEVKVGKIEENLHNVYIVLGKMETSIEKSHDKIDQLAIEFQKFGGLASSLSHLQQQVSENSKWIAAHDEFIDNWRKRAENVRSKWVDLAFRLVPIAIMLVLAAYMAITQYNSNQTAIQQLTEALQE